MDPQNAAPDPMLAHMREERRADAARLNIIFGFLIRRLERIMHTLEDTLALVQAERTDIGSLAALAAGIKKQLDDALGGELTPSQQMRVDKIFDQIQQNKQAVADAIKATDNVGDNITDTTVTSSNSRSNVGDSVVFTAAVAKHPDAPADKNPTGPIVFTIDGTQVGSVSVGADGTAQSAAITNLTEGDHQVTATYAGDSVFETSTSQPLTQTVVAVSPQPGVGQNSPPQPQPVTDPATGRVIDPVTGRPIDPNQNQNIDPAPGRPLVDGQSRNAQGQTIDPATGRVIDPVTGQPVA